MNLHFIDWSIVAVFTSTLLGFALIAQKYNKSVADFLAAGRCAGRYVITVNEGATGIDVISIVALFQMYYIAGFVPLWWGFYNNLVLVLITLTGWVIYRFRQTRALTMGQFFELRYSKGLRIASGLLAYLGGILNFGIFPAVGARFFMAFCGLPENVIIGGIQISVFMLLMFFLIGTSLAFCLAGGQVAVIITDFVQGLFMTAVLTLVILIVLITIGWDKISEALLMAPDSASLINPFHTSKIRDFNFCFFAIIWFKMVYGHMSFLGESGYNCSAKTPHEARMGRVLGTWRNGLIMFYVLVPICAYTLLNHPDFASIGDKIRAVLAISENPEIRNQMSTPVALAFLLPKGVMGLLAAACVAALISTHDTYLHAWGSILIQDVVLPLRKKPLSPKQHMWLLRGSITVVAIFIFFFSLLFKQNQRIRLFQILSSALFTAGAGSIIIGGLYWKRATTAGAWSSLIVGATLGLTGLIYKQIRPDFFLNGAQIWFVVAIGCILTYVTVSLLSKRPDLDWDRLFHRGKYSIIDENELRAKSTKDKNGIFDRMWAVLRMGPEFTFGDKLIYVLSFGWNFGWTFLAVVGTIYCLAHEVSDQRWLQFWHIQVWLGVGLSILVMVWFTIGGLFDIKDMFRRLRLSKRNYLDDGRVVDHHNYGEGPPSQAEANETPVGTSEDL